MNKPSKRHKKKPQPQAQTVQKPEDKQYVTRTQGVSYSGPIPPPGMPEQYNALIPNGADRILKMAESQQQHRQALEKKVVGGDVVAQSRGQVIGVVVFLAALGTGTYLAAIGKSTAGLVAIIVTTTTFAGLFVFSRVTKDKEIARKR